MLVLVLVAEALRTLDISKLMVIWPNNVDATKTIKKGRRIPKASACELVAWVYRRTARRLGHLMHALRIVEL